MGIVKNKNSSDVVTVIKLDNPLKKSFENYKEFRQYLIQSGFIKKSNYPYEVWVNIGLSDIESKSFLSVLSNKKGVVFSHKRI